MIGGSLPCDPAVPAALVVLVTQPCSSAKRSTLLPSTRVVDGALEGLQRQPASAKPGTQTCTLENVHQSGAPFH